ncbi:MAG: hypothetical protein WBA51_05430 [Erythrobacter sp.]
MIAKRRLTPAFNVALICAAALSLSGCVAAAIPVLAGGVLVRSQTDGKGTKGSQGSKAQGEVTVADAATPEPGPVVAQQTPDKLAASANEASPMAKTAKPAASSSATGRFIVEAENAPAVAPGIAGDPFADLVAYAKARDIIDPALKSPGQEITASAMLLEPAELNAKRKPCAGTTPTVLIDLDPKDSVFGPGASIAAPDGAAASLASLRENEIAVAWISGASAAYAGDVRVALKESGLDPSGKDTLLMMRYPGDRKQTRREDLAASSCLIAIAGDERRDFDELFAYLVNPEAALGLELLIGDGWFLVPRLVARHSLTTQPETAPQTQTSQIANRP